MLEVLKTADLLSKTDFIQIDIVTLYSHIK